MSKTKGIILAGGNGSRLYPLTRSISKQLLPVYDKPMIYYPLSTLIEVGIKEILIISTPRDLPRFKELLGDGSLYGINLNYEVQNKPKGIAEAFLIGSKFISNENVCLILGDNIFYSEISNQIFLKAIDNLKNNISTIFSVAVDNPKEFGVIDFNNDGTINKITEKPETTLSNRIVSGLYFYTNDVKKIVKKLKPSKRGELEITDLNNHYLKNNKLACIDLDDKFFWSDTGTYDSLHIASEYFRSIEIKTGDKVACIEKIALDKGYISRDEFNQNINRVSNSNYGKFLKNFLDFEI